MTNHHRRRPLIALSALALASVALASVHGSGAAFTSSSTTILSASTDSIHDWLHVWTARTDPLSDPRYLTLEGTTTPAASGSDETATVDLGSWAETSAPATASALFALQARGDLPAGVTTVSVTVTATPDPATGRRPLASVALAPFGAPEFGDPTAELAPDDKMQVNATIDLRDAPPDSYGSSVIVTLTYEGSSATYYQYEIPVSISRAAAAP